MEVAPGGTLFVTGMQRSGTTLVDKLLTSHPDVSVLSQPFPFLLFEAKRRFLRQLAEAETPLPFGPVFQEERYRPEDLAAFLREETIDGAAVRRLVDAMTGYSGQYTRVDPERLDAVLATLAPSPLGKVLAHLTRGLAEPPGAQWCGAKETLAEELLPHLLEAGLYCLLVVRDPRDVLASLNHGRGEQFAGRLKPTLWNLRHWRKSVAFALHLESEPRFLWLRYEDLVREPESVLRRVGSFLGLADLPEAALAGELRDQAGQPWVGNSSHGDLQGISTASVGSWKRVLPSSVATFAEAACLPELLALGYPVDLDERRADEVLDTFEEPYPMRRSDLAGYGSDPASRATERQRLDLLREAGRELSERWFLFADVGQRLARALEQR